VRCKQEPAGARRSYGNASMLDFLLLLDWADHGCRTLRLPHCRYHGNCF
jgi:uncharacterized protein with GYD domain